MLLAASGSLDKARLQLPLVSIVTPVFNGEKYLERCINSVIRQDYENWTYTIVNNCSTDRSLEIAREAAGRDPRIRVVDNERFVGAIENHNIAFRQVSPQSEFCKLLSADDWIYPNYLSTLIAAVQRNPTAAIISCYSIKSGGVTFPGFSVDDELLIGKAVIRRFLLGELDTFWLPACVMYRAALVRGKTEFYPGSAPSADLEACLNCLAEGDLCFVHQILAFERVHDETITSRLVAMKGYLLDRIRIVRDRGPRYLSNSELRQSLNSLLWLYYKNVLVGGLFRGETWAFWSYHVKGLRFIGYSVFDWRLFAGVAIKLADVVLNPLQTVEKIGARLRRAWRR